MKRCFSAIIVGILGITGAGISAASATAIPSGIVTSSEFYSVHSGDSIAFVRDRFGSNGKVVSRYDPPGNQYDWVSLEFPTYYDDGEVTVDFVRDGSGVWVLDTKLAYWGVSAIRTSNKATPSEFYAVKPGNSIGYARSTFGTSGTITSYYDAPGTSYDFVTIEWPTTSKYGSVTLDFDKRSSGSWKVESRTAFWGINATRTSNKATQAEFNRVRPGNSIAHARSTFGTSGTITSYYDAPGTSYDFVTIEWPTTSKYGSVTLDFDKRSSGSWKVDSRYAYWG